MAEEYKTGTGTGRGGWRGGGRHKIENPKKMYSFRLSEEELKEVRDLLAKMRSKIIILLFMLFVSLPCFAFEYTIDTAREEALKDIPHQCIFPNPETYHRSTYVKELDTNNILASEQINNRYIDVIYKDLPDYIYRYEYSKGKWVADGYYGNSIKKKITDKKVAIYSGSYYTLIGVILNVSDNEKYTFDMDGNLVEYIRGSEHKRNGLKWSTIKKHSPTYSAR